MLIGNKLAVHYMPAPSFVLWCQLAISAASVWLLGTIKVDALNMKKIIIWARCPLRSSSWARSLQHEDAAVRQC